MIIIYISNQ